MRIAMFMQWEGVTIDQYEQVRKLVNWDIDKAVGGVVHICAHDGKNLRITDVWESEDDFNNFVNQRLMPKVQEVGITSQPKVEVFPLHNLFTPGL